MCSEKTPHFPISSRNLGLVMEGRMLTDHLVDWVFIKPICLRLICREDALSVPCSHPKDDLGLGWGWVGTEVSIRLSACKWLMRPWPCEILRLLLHLFESQFVIFKWRIRTLWYWVVLRVKWDTLLRAPGAVADLGQSRWSRILSLLVIEGLNLTPVSLCGNFCKVLTDPSITLKEGYCTL